MILTHLTKQLKSRAILARLTLVAACGFAVTASTGCSWWQSLTGTGPQPDDVAKAPRATSRPATTQFTTAEVTPLPPNLLTENRPVVQGKLPLVYLVEANGTLRVRNTQTNEEIISFDAKATQIVRVDTKGVFLAGKSVIGATLIQGEYAIEFVYSDADGVRSTQQRDVIQTQ